MISKNCQIFVSSQEVGASCVSAAPCPPSCSLCFRSPTHQPPSTPLFQVFQGWIGRLSSEATIQQGSTRRLLSTAFGRRAPGKRRVHVHPAFRPTLTIEDLGTSKPTSCTDFCVAHKVNKSSQISTILCRHYLSSRIIRSILARERLCPKRQITLHAAVASVMRQLRVFTIEIKH